MFHDDCVELRGLTHCVFVPSARWLDTWLVRGFVRVPDWRMVTTIRAAFDHDTPCSRYEEIWKRLFRYRPFPNPWYPHCVESELAEAARGSIPLVYVLERRIERAIVHESPKLGPPPLSPRTTTDHYVVIEAVTNTEPPAPVPGLRLELLIADGEIKSAQTDANGVARVERIQAGRVVIRVLDLDGARWRPLEGDASQPSGSGERPRLHVTRRGECLSKIAHRYGVENWQRVWDHPDNERLRKQRTTPHLLLPGDEVVVPATCVHELIRPTDATHRIVVTHTAAIFQVVLQDHNRRAFKHQPYELSLPDRPEEPHRNGTTDDRGGIVERLRAEARRVEVRLVRLGLSWTFALSDMVATPGDEARGEVSDDMFASMAVMAAQARLNALGFASGAVDGKLGPRTRAALAVYGATQSGDPLASPEELSGDPLLALHDRFLA